jgi:hypothetical protein
LLLVADVALAVPAGLELRTRTMRQGEADNGGKQQAGGGSQRQAPHRIRLRDMIELL